MSVPPTEEEHRALTYDKSDSPVGEDCPPGCFPNDDGDRHQFCPGQPMPVHSPDEVQTTTGPDGNDRSPGAGALRGRVAEEYLRYLRSPAYRDAVDITSEWAEGELRRLLALHPGVAPEVAAFGLLRRVDSWDELHAITRAVAAVLADPEVGGTP